MIRHGGFPDDREAKPDRFAVAERKGREAFAAGLKESDCPYDDKRKASGKVSWSRAWRNAWVMGYRLAKFENKEA